VWAMRGEGCERRGVRGGVGVGSVEGVCGGGTWGGGVVSHAATLRDLKLDLGVMCRVERICCLDLVQGVWTKIERKIERRSGVG